MPFSCEGAVSTSTRKRETVAARREHRGRAPARPTAVMVMTRRSPCVLYGVPSDCGCEESLAKAVARVV